MRKSAFASVPVSALLALISGTASAANATKTGGSSFPPFDSSTFAGQLFWLAVTFGSLYVMMKSVALPRIRSILDERRETIDSALRSASAAQKSAEEAAVAHEQALAKAKANAQAIATEARAKSAKEIETERHAVESDLSAKMVAAETRIGETKAKAMSNVDEIARDAVGAIIEQLTGKAPSSAAVAKAVASPVASKERQS